MVTYSAILSGFVEDGYVIMIKCSTMLITDNALFYTSTGQKIINNTFSSYGNTASG